MKKFKAVAIMLAVIICLSAVSIPNAFGQLTSGIKVLSYTTYVNSAGDFIAVGEIQNQGNITFQSVSLDAGVYSADNSELTSYSSAVTLVNFLVPQEKAPFYINFGSPNETDTDISLVPSVSYLNFTVSNAPPTNDKEYQNLSYSIGFQGAFNGAYVAEGIIRNMGNQTANAIKVVGTYYNSAGNVVAVGFNNVTGSLPPGNATAFTISEYDITPNLVAQISSCALLVDTSTLQYNQNNSTTPTPTTTSGAGGGSLPVIYYYAIVVGAVVAVILITVVFLVFRKRKVTSAPLPPPPPPPPES